MWIMSKSAGGAGRTMAEGTGFLGRIVVVGECG